MKITITKQDIVGPHKLPGFNGVGEINLEKFEGREIEIPEGYEFESLGSLDLDTEVDELDDIWSNDGCLLYTSPSPRDVEECRMPSSA